MAEGDITTGMYFIVAFAASSAGQSGSTAANAKILCRRGGNQNNPNERPNDMVIYTQSARSTPIMASVYVDSQSGEAMIYAPLLNGRSACVKKSDMYQPTNNENEPDGDPYPRENAVVFSEAYSGSQRQRWKIEQVPNKTGWYDGGQYQAYILINAMSPDDHKMVMTTNANSNGSYVKFTQYISSSPSESQYWLFIPQSHVPDGFYNIRMATAPDRLLIGQSNGDVTIASDTDRMDNRHIWYLNAGEDPIDPALQFTRNLGGILANKDSGYLLVNSGQNVQNGHPNIGRLTDGGHYDEWVFMPGDESDEYNDSKYQAYYLISSGFDYSYWAASRYSLCGYQASNPSKFLTKPTFQLIAMQEQASTRRYQWFLTWAHAFNSELTVPTKLGVTLDDMPYFSAVGLRQNESIYPSWVGGDVSDDTTSYNWQMRYRIRSYRKIGDAATTNRTYTDTAWKSILDDDPSNGGWGDAEVPNCQATLMYNEDNSVSRGASGRYVGYLSLPGLSGMTFGGSSGNVDRYLIQFEVRAWASTYEKVSTELSCHGGSASALIRVVYRPELTLSALKVDAYGLYLNYSSDLHRGYNKITIESPDYAKQYSVSKLGRYSVSSVLYTRTLNQSKCVNGNAPRSGKYYLDFGGIIPEVNQELPFTWTITTVDGITATGSTVLAVQSVDLSDAVSVSCTPSYLTNGSRILKIDIPAPNSGLKFTPKTERCTLVINNRPNGSSASSQFVRNSSNLRYLEYVDVPISRTSSGAEYFAIPYPFGRPFKVEIVGDTNDSQGRIGRYEYYGGPFSDFRNRTRMWNYGTYLGSIEWFEIFVNEGNNPTESVTTQFTSNAVKTTERDWELVQFGNTPEQSRSVSGIVYSGLMADYVGRTEDFAKCKYAWYRSYDGEVMRVAITSVRETRDTWGTQVSVEMRRTDV